MSIQQEIILRHKSSGHVRFQIPERLCSDEVASFVSDAINDFDGVYRVNLFRNKQKLAIRFVEENLPFQELVQQLLTLLSDLEKKGFFKAKPDAIKTSSFTNNLKLSNWKGTRWAKDKYTETKETAQAISILAKLGLKKNPKFSLIPKKP
ncbi:hypothetical protein bplSymb_SCF00402P009 [Bathymodiolus platifrons methanotrophic gill symbiont]|uniref:hypothetical protein n=1 Tax=Bathymodiolus platifrons methanotrophic gill symbiont TaxID=113268 RepID=UPI000B415894|nr:hypothetical protein [Bathymodiolus platifrons methanotrophic gill symbiont]GAW85168.1 hypothetical protein bplSymb_SCF00402P009 [Bathymodiolus platifrons methanotrophic gill symbiont]